MRHRLFKLTPEIHVEFHDNCSVYMERKDVPEMQMVFTEEEWGFLVRNIRTMQSRATKQGS